MSAGFVPQMLKDQLREANISFPDPFFGRSMGPLVLKALMERGIPAPDQWISKKLAPHMKNGSDLIITALNGQKVDLKELYPEAKEKTFTIKPYPKSSTAFLIAHTLQAGAVGGSSHPGPNIKPLFAFFPFSMHSLDIS